jgi:hypothetical protein
VDAGCGVEGWNPKLLVGIDPRSRRALQSFVIMVDYRNAAFVYAYEIEKTVEVYLADGRTYRLEVARRVKGDAQQDYEVRYYRRRAFEEATSGSRPDSQEASRAAPLEVWDRDMDLPSVEMQSAEAALKWALHWLVDRYEARSKAQ